MKLGLAVRQQHNLQAALLPLGQRRPVNMKLTLVAGRVLHLQRTAAPNLNAIVKDSTFIQPVITETGARIVDLKQLYCPACTVLHRGLDMIGMAAGQKSGKHHCG